MQMEFSCANIVDDTDDQETKRRKAMSGIRQTLTAVAAALLLVGTAHAADVFTITSSSFKDGTLLAKKNAGANKSNPNCVGENVSPPLAWTNVPAGTTSFALVMTDPEGRGTGVDHWIA